jgi:hypothetical protein
MAHYPADGTEGWLTMMPDAQEAGTGGDEAEADQEGGLPFAG